MRFFIAESVSLYQKNKKQKQKQKQKQKKQQQQQQKKNSDGQTGAASFLNAI